jgi:hypothetical protein
MAAELKLHLDPGAISSTEGAVISTWPEVSGYGRNVTPQAGTAYYSPTGMNGLPGVVVAPNEWFLGQGVLSQYIGASAWAMVGAFRPRAIDTNDATIYNNDALICDAAGYWGLFLKSAPSITAYVWDGSAKVTPAVTLGGLNQVIVVSAYQTGGTLYLAINGGAYVSVASGMPSTVTGAIRVGRNHVGGSYYDGVYGQWKLWDDVPTDLADQVSALLAYYGVQRIAGVEDARDVGSRIVRAYRRPVQQVQFRVRPERGLDLVPGTVVALDHREIPHPSGSGAGVKTWERWLGRVWRQSIVPGAPGYVDIQARRLDPLSLWWVPYTAASGLLQQQGVLRILTGQTWTYTRASTAYVEDPGDGHVIEASVDVEALDRGGWLAETERTNYILDSGFSRGILGNWTGAGGASIITPASLLFDASLSRYAAELPSATSGNITQAITSGGLQYWYLSVDHEDDSGGALDWRLQRSSDSKYFNAGTGAWDVAATVNFFATRTTRTRDYSGLIDAGAAAGNLTLRLRSSTSGDQRVYFVQLEPGRWPTSRILTRTATVARTAGRLLVSNNTAARAWNAARGTARITLVPWWTSSEVGSTAFTLLWISYDANNSIRLWYDGSAGAWKFTRTRGGVATTASITASTTRGTEVELVVRWASTELELGLAAYTGSVFAAGTKGTDDTSAAGAPTEVGTCDLEIGSGSSAYADGWIRRLLITPLVLLDEQIARAD